ncbi:hypothetical protein EU537_05625 [Candidatus Thorarchaeota archaeon]|nr:MAG: hypothetical protein EU537_05625 [Candidatus Thorarchaeota archaeon]
MLISYLLGGIVVIVLAVIAYGTYIEVKQLERQRIFRTNARRDMWKASLLDCEYEPAKYAFGPGKAIPSDRIFTRHGKDESFSSHMQKK